MKQVEWKKQMLWINEKKISTMVKRNERTDDYGYCYSNDMLQISDSTIYMWNFKEKILSKGKNKSIANMLQILLWIKS
ncbi:hypothetical protein DERP_008546 [Dermatophagoides pteronyssinus]|uniref:Uncharacterized protein n=1 Tax=Dermatophagoides pteronyssinus TaxID=6956 RepID=A0ABQ8IWK0_DERPT|nr:hypothetical protein DERP_008546 [Dermatophagoides pteronyssinus]